ncbi:hypothetical protein AUC43_08425 [Hymenobacter sedentarius]|uniref:HEPN domain-containing protein n=1 Tax=Hymenobacter sedentarius TaxID=1411621 RepID=A0A0U4BMX7_9BACT|nr:HEPN domain-containing protein [Hymenobacter sedentarius]ALW85114.1 hypothetical protein AUC43_08425 [Hymenobacter sedentarius]
MQPLNQAEKAYLQEWLDVADLDLRAAERMLADDPVAYGYHLPFACQQAVEKYCKGVLLAQGNSFPRVHDLPELLNRLTPGFAFSSVELDDADKLADYAVETRYPPHTRITPAEMQEAVRIARYFQGRLRPFIQTALL